ncbi:hypothetical protein SBOR_9676 [Sclerotinia borealis F-4128]|uniref:Uncharacterized protein n=1 Tax=Sclerotinia borealis (strain F-4128) TaxID=1432307 RepID=W9C4V8_SCLBF|nr:hypothetical protein SBOR_9676 [Sclerotinia borealis F-4128]
MKTQSGTTVATESQRLLSLLPVIDYTGLVVDVKEQARKQQRSNDCKEREERRRGEEEKRRRGEEEKRRRGEEEERRGGGEEKRRRGEEEKTIVGVNGILWCQ